MLYDVIIVGAGPSGAYLGNLVASAGYSVLILDRSGFPRDKVCGGGISPKTLRLLDFDISPVVQQHVHGAYLTYRNDSTFVKDLGTHGGVTVLRAEFDHLLVKRAEMAGAQIRERDEFLSFESVSDVVKVLTTRSSFKCKFLIGADGVFSRVRNQLFGKNAIEYVASAEALVYVPPEIIEKFGGKVLFDFGGMTRGYGWIFPKRDHLNVGVFSPFRTRSVKNELQKFIANYPSLRSSTRMTIQGHSVPVKNRVGEYQKNNVWLLGDAAGCAESFFGEGIYFALQTARMACDALNESFHDAKARVYTDLMTQRVVPDLKYARASARLFFPYQKLAFDRMVRNKKVNSWFAGLISGTVGYRQAFYRTLLTAPLWLFAGQHASEECAVL